jgi:protein transport protein SEC24
VLDNPFSQRVNAIIQKTREMRRGVYYPHLYVVKEDGEPPLRLWALSALIQDRADVLPSYQQFISSLKEKVRLLCLLCNHRECNAHTFLLQVNGVGY